LRWLQLVGRQSEIEAAGDCFISAICGAVALKVKHKEKSEIGEGNKKPH
jgi:hypothetical protein